VQDENYSALLTHYY